MKTVIYDNFNVANRYDEAKKQLKIMYEGEDKEISDYDIYEEMEDIDNEKYQKIINELQKFFNNKLCIFDGWLPTELRYRKIKDIGTFKELFQKYIQYKYDYTQIYDDNGELYIECSHDGELKKKIKVRIVKNSEDIKPENIYKELNRYLQAKTAEEDNTKKANYLRTKA